MYLDVALLVRRRCRMALGRSTLQRCCGSASSRSCSFTRRIGSFGARCPSGLPLETCGASTALPSAFIGRAVLQSLHWIADGSDALTSGCYGQTAKSAAISVGCWLRLADRSGIGKLEEKARKRRLLEARSGTAPARTSSIACRHQDVLGPCRRRSSVHGFG